MGAKPPSTQSLISTYDDSVDLKLRRHHLTLRVREQGDQRIQTIKREDSANVEWEDAIAGEQPDFETAASKALLHDIIGKEELRPYLG